MVASVATGIGRCRPQHAVVLDTSALRIAGATLLHGGNHTNRHACRCRGSLVAAKSLILHATPTAPSYSSHFPFGAQSRSLAVGELVSTSGGSGYNEEVVIAANTGLMWMHIDELAASGIVLPATGIR